MNGPLVDNFKYKRLKSSRSIFCLPHSLDYCLQIAIDQSIVGGNTLDHFFFPKAMSQSGFHLFFSLFSLHVFGHRCDNL